MVTNSAQTGGQSVTTSRSPRPAGPSAQALKRLVTTPHKRIMALAMKTSLTFRTIICVCGSAAAQCRNSTIEILSEIDYHCDCQDESFDNNTRTWLPLGL